jgi:hypothetical protein
MPDIALDHPFGGHQCVIWALQIQPKDFPVGIRFEHGLDDHP